MTTVVLENINKSYPKEGSLNARQSVLKNINTRISNGRTTVILGPSGCGKTSLLKLIAGLEKPDSGTIYFNAQDMNTVSAKDRKLGMVFQDFALYPSWDVKNNIMSYFRFRKKTPELDEEAKAKYQRTSDLMGIDIAYLLDRKPKNLSPGEKQRVALARCITRDPNLFLLDEPFTHLDQHLREKYRSNLKQLLKEFNITTIYVTHDQTEALLLADEIIMMNSGKIVQTGSYNNLHKNPKNLFVASFLSPNPLMQALNTQNGNTLSAEFNNKIIGIRPEDLSLNTNTKYSLNATLINQFDLPNNNYSLLTLSANQETLHAYLPHPNQKLPETLSLGIKRFFIFNKETQELESHYKEHHIN